MLPDAKELKRILQYDPDTGSMTWLRRPRDLCSSEKIYNQLANMQGRPAFVGKTGRGYLGGTINGKLVLAHRVAWALQTGEWPDKDIDHLNGDGCDNRWCNLRLAGEVVNMRNQRLYKNNKTGHHGISKSKYGCFVVTIGVEGKSLYLGSFKSLSEAIAARQEAELKYNFHENHGRAA